MQYYLNGFKPGDPDDHRSNADLSTHKSEALPEQVDVLIVGCGPAGLLLAAQLARFPDICTRIVDQKTGPLEMGQADGVSGRSLEIFQALGFSERVLKEAYFLEAITFWASNGDKPEEIVRRSKKIDGRGAFSEFPHVVLNQARVHQFLLDRMAQSPAQLSPHYGHRLIEMKIDESGENPYPVEATLERDGQSERQRIAARYVVGCDGARSTVRQKLGLELRGDSANKAWGVMDLLVVSDFPDIRIKSIIQSDVEGALLIIPREGGHLVRLYVEMDKLKESERVASLNITIENLIAAARRILHPYTLDVREVVWWSVYEIGQRVCESFANRPTTVTDNRWPNVFIVGDACHTHSPKAGQGMNVSMHDSFNLGWKLASVIRGRIIPDVLSSYEAERRAIARELIDFDRELSTMFSVQNDDTHDATQLEKYMIKHDGYVSGTQTRYSPSLIVAESDCQELAEGFRIGTRLDACPVVRLTDARPLHLRHALEADGRWRIIGFGDAAHPESGNSGLIRFVEYLQNHADSPIRRYTGEEEDIDAVIELLAVFQQDFRDVDITSLPDLLWPAKGIYGLRDHSKVFCPDLHRGVDIYDVKGIDREKGCAVVVRPDQHVAGVWGLDGLVEMGEFFAGFMVER